MCKKQTSVSHRSTESEIISLDAGLRMDGLTALAQWDVVIEVLRSTKGNTTSIQQASGNRCETGVFSRNRFKPKPKGNRDVDQLTRVDHVLSCKYFDDEEAVIKMNITGRIPTIRLVSRGLRLIGCV